MSGLPCSDNIRRPNKTPRYPKAEGLFEIDPLLNLHAQNDLGLPFGTCAAYYLWKNKKGAPERPR
jgi:hypothetical protein